MDNSRRQTALHTVWSRARSPEGRRWYRIDNATDNPEILIYDDIGFFGITAQDFATDLQQVKANKLTVRLNTRGGEVFDGIAIYNALRDHPAEVTTICDGVAASIGSVIMQAGDRRVMNRNTQMMIHEASGLCAGTAGDMRELAQLLDKATTNIASIYAERAGGDQADWGKAMAAETWFDADEAVKAGLADELVNQTPKSSVMTAALDLSIYQYAGRPAAPAPTLLQPPTPVPSLADVWTPDLIRNQLREALA